MANDSFKARAFRISVALAVVALSELPAAQIEAPGALLWQGSVDGTLHGGDHAASVVVDNQGNAVAAGTSQNRFIEGCEFTVTKFDRGGAVLWQRNLFGTPFVAATVNRALSVAVDEQGNVAAAGYLSNDGTGQDFTVAKFDPNGERLWVQVLNGISTDDIANSVAIDHQGNVVAAGRVQGLFTVAKFDGDGILRWEQKLTQFGGEAAEIAVDDEGDVVAAGSTDNAAGGLDFTVVKLDRNGFLLWQQNLHGASDPRTFNVANSVAVDHEGNVAAAGTTLNKPGWPVSKGLDFTVAKFDRDGTLLWLQNLNGASNVNDEALSVAMDNNGNVVAAGHTSNTGTLDSRVTKFASDGTLLWQRDQNGPHNGVDGATAVAVDEAGNVVTSGTIAVTFHLDGRDFPDQQFTVTKFDPDGTLLWQQNLHGNGFDGALSVAVDNRGRVAAAGSVGGDFTVAMFDR
jgi:uncharacterized delta-60 repeat protein